MQKGKKGHPFVAASFNEQSVKGSDMASKCHKISTFRKDDDVDLFFDTETRLSAQGDNAKTVETFPHQSLSCGGGIATIYKSNLRCNITFKTNT